MKLVEHFTFHKKKFEREESLFLVTLVDGLHQKRNIDRSLLYMAGRDKIPFGELTNEGKRESLDGIKFLAKNCIHPLNSSNLLVSI